MKIALLILAAGRSTRMGVAKQLLPIGETTLLGITIKNAIQSNSNKVFCVLGANAKAIKQSLNKYNIETIFNPDYKSGLSSSIIAGIQHIKNKNFDAALIVLGDQPLITTKFLNEMIDAYRNHSDKIIATTYKETIGVPTIIPKTYFNDLLTLQGDKGAKAFLNSKKHEIMQLDRANILDIDTKKDYQDFINSTNFE